MSTSWCVTISCLPPNIKPEQLAQQFNIHEDDISIPDMQDGLIYDARVNGFSTKNAAKQFELKWNNTQMFSATIKCETVPEQRNHIHQQHSSQPIRDRNEIAHSTISKQSADDNECSPRLANRVYCKNDKKCFNAKCTFDHPPGWDACEDGINCEEFYCKSNHPYGRTKPCRNGHRCNGTYCKCLHPSPDKPKCPQGIQCHVWKCHAWHPKQRPKDCSEGQKCHNASCGRLHPFDHQVCLSGSDCTDVFCMKNHPPSRPPVCDDGVKCGYFYCHFLHPIEWDPCEAGINCDDSSCSHKSHPTDHNLSSNQDASMENMPWLRLRKSVEQRNLERQQVQLPIFASKDEFCRRLENERVLVVTAETGSGKSTQLPQYAAEYFGGLVVCTQPRVIAAISLARRVADEYDGMPVGSSVGYRVGITGATKGHNRVPGTDIVFMTDGALIQDSTQDRELNDVRVLIIDEAHERSLNTDIVMGLAKLLLQTRPTDFYVVITSATIDPTKFLEFFDRSDALPMNVPGRIYEVNVENIPKSIRSMEEHAVNTLLQLYDQHEGNTLVFLSGQQEIEQAIELFSRSMPKNCVAFPLYGALSLEEQDRVLKFDQGPNGESRMVVFCTNIAETSLTIKNTRLIIDSGLAKESRFNNEFRVKAIETMIISRASADQRKGRAGRTAPGHCVRLYEEHEVVRPDIEPAILRSSLDLVVLQLIHLRLDPLTFPFIDPPDLAVIHTALQLLEDLSCIDSDQNITLRGELFVKLNFDPRFSAFFVDTYLEHAPILELVTTMVAILTAPGSLFIIGGTDEEKKDNRNRIARGAEKHESDLFYLVSVYNDWNSSFIVDSNTDSCPTCHKSCGNENICRPCRAAYSKTRELNNKIFNIVERVYNATIETIQHSRWQLTPDTLSDANVSDIIGRNLFKHFPTHYGHFCVPRRPDQGVLMPANSIRAKITDTSTFMQRKLDYSGCIAMSIIQRPNNKYLIELLHPFQKSEKAPTTRISQAGENNGLVSKMNSLRLSERNLSDDEVSD